MWAQHINKVLIVQAVLLIMALQGCSSKSDEPFRVAFNNWIGHGPLYLAINELQKQNPNVQLLITSSANDVALGLRNGTLEAGGLTLDEALRLSSEGIPLFIVAVLDTSNGADAVVAKQNVQSLDDLRGHRLAVEHNAVGALVLSGMLKVAKMTKKDLEIVNCTFHDHLKCYNNADAVITFEPVVSELKLAGGHVLFDSSQIPGQIVDVLVVRQDRIGEFNDILPILMESLYQAVDRVNRRDETALALLSEYAGLTDEELKRAYGGIVLPDVNESRRLLLEQPTLLEEKIHSLEQVLVDEALLFNQERIQVSVWNQYFQELQ